MRRNKGLKTSYRKLYPHRHMKTSLLEEIAFPILVKYGFTFPYENITKGNRPTSRALPFGSHSALHCRYLSPRGTVCRLSLLDSPPVAIFKNHFRKDLLSVLIHLYPQSVLFPSIWRNACAINSVYSKENHHRSWKYTGP